MSKIARLIKDKIYILTFLSIISLPAIQLFTNVIEVDSDMEKRSKVSRPSITGFENTSDYFIEYENYFKDNFGFRSNLISLNSKIDVDFFKQSSNKDVVIGKNDYLFFNDEMDTYNNTNLLSDSDINFIAQKVSRFQTELANRGVYFLISLAPNKSTIYPEYVGTKPTNPNTISNLDRLQSSFDSLGVNYVDLKSELLKNKDTHELYYKKDTHWNTVASTIAANAYLSNLNSIFGTNTSIISKNIQKGIYDGDLDNLLGFYSKTPEVLSDYEVLVSGNKLPKAISYGDSFGGPLFLSMSDAFEQNVLPHVVSSPPASNYHLLNANVKIFNFEIVERNIHNLINYEFNIFDDDITNLNNMYNPTNLNLAPSTNIITKDLAYIPNETNTYISTKADSGYLSFKDINTSDKIDYIYLEFENNNSHVPVYLDFSNNLDFAEKDTNPSFMLLPNKNKYLLDLRNHNTTFNNLNFKIGSSLNSFFNLKNISFYTQNNLK